MGKAIFVGGTASNVGKSWMCTALCRLLRLRGYRVAPFKAQNMSNNSFPCVGGGEIGRSQVAQAEACGLEPQRWMNPVLLKPTADSCSQVILHGEIWRTIPASEYYRHTPFLRAEALKAFRGFADGFDLVIVEGAGSVAEINLWDHDFTNLSMAEMLGARSLLVADIERGGVFASILGTFDLLPPRYRELIHAFAVNRFRGDPSLFEEGVSLLEKRSGVPCLGVFPYTPDIHLDAEDSLSTIAHEKQHSHPRIAIIRFPRVSNTTDFQLLPAVDWLDKPKEQQYEWVILPGTKSTLADLRWMRERGLDTWITQQHRAGARVLGICGGYQMLGETVEDPNGVDGPQGCTQGLGLLPARTVMESRKTTRTRNAKTLKGTQFPAYEIHVGRTELTGTFPPFAILEDGSADGVLTDRVIGTYLHGCLQTPALVEELLQFTPNANRKMDHYDALANWLESNSSGAVLGELIA